MMFEEEAKMKWCPMLINLRESFPVTARCKGSECMAWVWEIEPMPTFNQEGCGYCGMVKQ